MKTKLLLGSVLILLSAGANAATYCVNPNKTSCDNTVQEGLDAAFAASDTSAVVVVAAGVYFEQGLLIEQAGLTLKGSGKVIIDSGKTIDGSGGFTHLTSTADSITINANDVSIKNISFYNNNDETIAVENGIRINSSKTGVTLNKVSVVNVSGFCVAASSADGLTITNSQFKNCGIGNDRDGINVNGDNITIKRNTIEQTGRDGIVSLGLNVLIIKNTVVGVVRDGITSFYANATIQSNKIKAVGGDGIISYDPDVLITKNRIEGAGERGVLSFGNNAIIQNNKIKAVGSTGIVSFDPDVLITKNRIEGAGGSGVISYNNNAIIQNNKIYSTGAEGISIRSLNATVKANRIKNTTAAGIRVRSGGGTSTLIKNIIIDSAETGIVVSDLVSGSVEVISNKVKNSRLALCAGKSAGGNISNFVTLEADNGLKGDIWVSGTDFPSADDCPAL